MDFFTKSHRTMASEQQVELKTEQLDFTIYSD